MNPAMIQEKIKQTITDILRYIGIEHEGITVSTDKEGHTAFTIKTKESSLLIGVRGLHIAALNHLARRIISKTLPPEEEMLDFYIDVNDYHEKLLQEIKNKTQILAGRARSLKTNVEMDPMPSYERMIVHTLLQDSLDIKTESVGSGTKRRVVLKYTGDSHETPIL